MAAVERWIFLSPKNLRLLRDQRPLSCCSWEHQVYAEPDGERSIGKEALRYRITVSSGLTLRAGTTDQYITTCRISRPEGDSWAPVDPDSKELLQLCETYGKDYILNPPDAAAENL